jgi:hypothetical protein
MPFGEAMRLARGNEQPRTNGVVSFGDARWCVCALRSCSVSHHCM